jgi:hypothetical protein
MKLKIHKANGEIKSAAICIDAALPDFEGREWGEKAHKIYRTDAQALNKALLRSLPGASYDWLMVEMMKAKASLFSVAWWHDQINQ